MENNPDLSREYYKTQIQQRKKNEKYERDMKAQIKEKIEEKDKKEELASELKLNLIKERIRLNREREEQKRKKRIKFIKGFTGVLALSSLMAVGIKKIYDYNTVNQDNIEYNEIVKDVMRHSGHGDIDPEGHKVTGFTKHACVAPNDGETYYTDRLVDALDEQYTENVINEIVFSFDELVKITGETPEVDAIKEQLTEIGDSLYKNEEGLWDSDLCKKENTRSR